MRQGIDPAASSLVLAAAFGLADAHDLPVYDALYLALAERLGRA